jgi:hypothetical protein
MPCSLAVITFAVPQADRKSNADVAMKIFMILDFLVRASC